MKTLLSTLFLAGSLVLGGCGNNSEISKSREEILSMHVGQSMPYDNKGIRINYNGMSDNAHFVLSKLGNRSVPFYYSLNTKEIFLDDLKFQINFVSPDSINLTWLGYTQ